jgi:predicted  nucleic acid-binding Zn-ribbon protein
MAREMDSLEKRNNSREEERAALAEEYQLQNTTLAAFTENWTKAEAELSAFTLSMENRLADGQTALEELLCKRANVGSEVPRPVLERYEFIRRRLDHPVIVSVKDGVCAGCRIAIPPQAFIELQSGQKILNCPNCQRLIYWCEHFKEEPDCVQSEAQTADAEV